MDDVFVCGVLRFLMPDGAKNGGCFRQEKGMEKKQHRRFAGFDLARRSGRTTLLGDGLDGWLASHGMQARHHMLTALWQNWDIVMGTELAPLAHPLGHRGNILLVGGDDSCAMQELSYAVPEILERVNAFMDEEYFHKVELHLLLGRNSLRRVDITEAPSLPPPPRPPRLGQLKLSPDSPLAACYEAYVRLFNGDDEKK